jgi:hypothetical protein
MSCHSVRLEMSGAILSLSTLKQISVGGQPFGKGHEGHLAQIDVGEGGGMVGHSGVFIGAKIE